MPIGTDDIVFFQSISNYVILAQSKVIIMQQAVAKYPKMSICCKGIQITTLLVSGNEVTLLYQSYFDKHLKPVVSPFGKEKGDIHSVFMLATAYDRQLPISMYIELDMNLMGLKVPDVEFFNAKDHNHILEEKHQTKLPV